MENEVMKCIRERRSIRKYDGRAVPGDIMEKIIMAGKYAPSAENRQPWKFVVVTNRDVISRLSERAKEQISMMLKQVRKWKKRYKELEDRQTLMFLHAVASSERDVIFHDAPAVVFVLTRDGAFNDESCACAAQNMMLAAHSFGIGSCWIGFAKFLEWNPETIREIGLPDGHHIAACIVFGYPKSAPKAAPRKPASDVIKWIN